MQQVYQSGALAMPTWPDANGLLPSSRDATWEPLGMKWSTQMPLCSQCVAARQLSGTLTVGAPDASSPTSVPDPPIDVRVRRRPPYWSWNPNWAMLDGSKSGLVASFPITVDGQQLRDVR